MDVKKRSDAQNRALHKLFELYAEELNTAGLTITKVIKVDIPWNKTTVKELLWRPTQETQVMKKSTTELTTKEIDQVFDVINKAVGELGLHVGFPSIEQVIHNNEL